MKIIGMMRYAVPVKSTEFLKSNKKVEDLYKDPYFSDRFKIFCGVTLQSFIQQTSKNFILLIYNHISIPSDKKALFDKLEKDYPFIKCIYVDNPDLPIPNEFKEDKQLTFRIDNDDGVAINFIENLEKACEETEDINYVISIPKIRKIMRIEKNSYKTISFTYPRKTHSMGLAYYSNDNKTIFDLGDHTEIYTMFKTKLLSGFGGLQILNGYNVGNEIGNAKVTLNKDKMNKTLIEEGYALINLESLPIVDIEKPKKEKLKHNKKSSWEF